MTIIAVYGGDVATYSVDRADYYAVEDIDLQVDDARYRRLTISGYLQLHVNDKQMAWMTDYITTQGVYTPANQFSDLWYQVVGNSGHFSDSSYAWLVGQSYQAEALSDMWYNFWNNPVELPTGA